MHNFTSQMTTLTFLPGSTLILNPHRHARRSVNVRTTHTSWVRPRQRVRPISQKCITTVSASASGTSIREGLIVEIQSQGSAVSSLGRRLAQVIRADGKRNWFVQDEHGQQFSIAPKQITFILGDPSTSDELSDLSLSTVYSEAKDTAGANIEVLELAWELLQEDDDETEEKRDIGAMSQLIMDDNSSFSKLATHVLLCHEANIYFKARVLNGVTHYEPRSLSNLSELKALRQSQKAEEEVRERRRATLSQALDQKDVALFQRTIESTGDKEIDYDTFIRHLSNIAVQYDPSSSIENHRYHTQSNSAFADLSAPYKNLMREVFQGCYLPLCPRYALQILIQLGVFCKHENILLKRNDFESMWTMNESLIQSEVERVLSTPLPKDPDQHLRVDLTHLTAIAIDSADTSEVDDAFSYDMETNAIYVHIADPARYFPALFDDPIVQLAMNRTSTLYLPHRKYTMFPPEIATRVLSLNGDLSDGSALSFKFDLDKEGEIVFDTMQILISRISTPIRLTYEEAGDIFTGEATPSTPEEEKVHEMMRTVSKKMELRRDWRDMEGGAIIINSPLSRVVVTDERSETPIVKVESISTDTLSWVTVSELMITACCIGAEVCVQNRVAAPFRCQEPFDYPPDEELERVEDGPVRAALTFRNANPTLTSLEPGEHASLGLDYYVQLTSPIRRSLDFLTHVQIKRFLSIQHETNVDDEKSDSDGYLTNAVISEEISKSQNVGRQLRVIESSTNRYWQMYYLQQYDKVPFSIPATFLKTVRDSSKAPGQKNALLHIDQLGFSITVKTWAEFKLGDKVIIDVRGVEVRENRIDATLRKVSPKTNDAEGDDLLQMLKDSLSQASSDG